MIDRQTMEKAVSLALEDGRGKRKFTQSVDMAINFKDVDFKKPESRLNAEVVLPHAPKKSKVAVFADGELALNAKKAGADLVIAGSEIASYASNKEKLKELLECSVLASPQLMAQVGKALGQVLSGKGKLPRPVMPNANLAELIERTRSSFTIRSKGKYLPCAHCIVGREDMKPEQITENASAVIEAIERKLSDTNIASVYFKTTMGKSFKVS